MIKSLLSKYPIIIQFSKFVLIGFLNTAIDFGILNLLMWSTGVYEGNSIILYNIIAFTAATINSYFWNKFWTFKVKQDKEVSKEFGKYIVISVIGAAINSSIVFGLATYMTPLMGLSRQLWANLAKVVATGVSLVWNFIGYKFIVFKKK